MLSSSSCHGARLVERHFIALCRYAWHTRVKYSMRCSAVPVQQYLDFSNKQYRYRACVFIPWGSHSSGFNAVGVDNARE